MKSCWSGTSAEDQRLAAAWGGQLNKLNEIVSECPDALDWNVHVSTEDEDTTHEAKLKNVNVCDCTITLEGEW